MNSVSSLGKSVWGRAGSAEEYCSISFNSTGPMMCVHMTWLLNFWFRQPSESIMTSTFISLRSLSGISLASSATAAAPACQQGWRIDKCDMIHSIGNRYLPYTDTVPFQPSVYRVWCVTYGVHWPKCSQVCVMCDSHESVQKPKVFIKTWGVQRCI